MALTTTQVSELYVAIFNRASEKDGNAFWAAKSLTAAEIADAMLATSDATTYFGTSIDTNQAFIEHIYLNTLNKTYAQDTAGVDYWVGLLNAGATRGEVVAGLVTAAKDAVNAGDAQDQFNNRVAVSDYTAATLDTAPADYATSTSFSSGLTVTKDSATVTTAKASVDSLVPQTFTLTSGTDTFTGGAGADTFNGSLTTVNSADKLIGGAGNDTANLEVSQDLSSTFTTTDVETINFTTYGARNVDMTAMTGVEIFNVKNSTGAVTLNNANSATMALSFEGTSTNNITANYKAGTLAGTADKLAIKLNAASAVSVDADAGFESAEITVTGTSDIDGFTAPGVVNVTLLGSGNFDIATGLMTGVETVTATSYTGNLTTGTANATTGFASGTITGSSNGTTVLLGTGTDNVGIVDASAATKSTTVKLGAGNDKLLMNAAGNAMYVFGEAGDDSISAATSALSSNDVIDGGEGTDTLYLDGSLANNAMVLKGIENVIITGTGAAQTFTNDDTASAITWKNDGSAVNLVNLTTGSTVTVENVAIPTTSTAGAVTVGFEAVEAANTIEVKTGMTGALTIDNIDKVTVNLGAASAMAASTITATSDVTELTINATGAMSTTGSVASTDNKLAKVTVTGSAAVTLGDFTSTGSTDISVTSGANATVGGANAGTLLDSYTVSATAGSITTVDTKVIGKTTNTATLDVTMTAKNAITSTTGSGTASTLVDIDSTKIGNINVTSTAGEVSIGEIGASATTIGDITASAYTNLNLGITGGGAASIGNATNAATSVGTISLTATTGAIVLADEGIQTKDAGGITVNMTAKTTISGDTSTSTATLVENEGGNITAAIAGAAAAYVNYTAITAGVVALTATNTGGLTSTITNASTAGAGATSTVTLGNAASATNAITMDGIVDTINITGGTGTDTVAFGSSDAIKNGTISLGGGTDTVDFSGLAITNSKGLAMNFSSSTIYFGQGYANETSLLSGKVAAYDATYYAGSTTAANKAIIADGQNFTVSGVETVVGSGAADYISVANTGMTVTGGAGADVIVLSAGTDTIDLNASSETFAAIALSTTATSETVLTGVDLVYGAAVGDKIDVAGVAGFTSGGTITASATTELAAVTANGQAMVTGSYDATTGKFTEGAASTTNNDILFEIADGTNIIAVVLVDVVGTITSATVSSDVFTLA